MNAGDYPPPKYEENIKNDSIDSIITGSTTLSSFPAPLQSLTGANINENMVTVTPFRANLISSTTPIFGPNPIETDCPFCQVCVAFLLKF